MISDVYKEVKVKGTGKNVTLPYFIPGSFYQGHLQEKRMIMSVKNFEKQVKKHPHKIALRSEKGFLTYLELNRFANRVARLIEKKCPEVGKGEKVGLLFDHGINMIAADAPPPNQDSVLPLKEFTLESELNQSKQIKHENWKDYSHQSTNFYEVQGDHYSIFTSPPVIDFAKKFDQIMKINKKEGGKHHVI
jgi:hypothetical protein